MSDGAPPPRIERRYWERRVVLLLVPAGIAAALLVGLLLGLGRGSGTEDDRGERTPIGITLPALEGAARADDATIAVRVPEGWHRPPLDRGVRVRSASGAVELAAIAAADPGRRGLVLEQATDAIRSAYSDVEVIERRDRGRIAGLQARRIVLEATNERDTRLRILIAAASGSDHTYLIQAFNATGAPRAELVDLQLALNSLELG